MGGKQGNLVIHVAETDFVIAGFGDREEMIQKEGVLAVGADEKRIEAFERFYVDARKIADTHRIGDEELRKPHGFHIFDNAGNAMVHSLIVLSKMIRSHYTTLRSGRHTGAVPSGKVPMFLIIRIYNTFL